MGEDVVAEPLPVAIKRSLDWVWYKHVAEKLPDGAADTDYSKPEQHYRYCRTSVAIERETLSTNFPYRALTGCVSDVVDLVRSSVKRRIGGNHVSLVMLGLIPSPIQAFKTVVQRVGLLSGAAFGQWYYLKARRNICRRSPYSGSLNAFMKIIKGNGEGNACKIKTSHAAIYFVNVGKPYTRWLPGNRCHVIEASSLRW